MGEKSVTGDITPETAEIAGIFAADGSMQKNHISFWGNSTEDVDYYDNVLKKLFKMSFNIEINPHHKPSNSVYGFNICKKEVIDYFNKSLDFKIGSKTYTVKVPKSIMQSKDTEIWCSFLRGFSDCDGTLNFDKRYYTCKAILKIIHTYPRIQLKSVSLNIIKDMSELLNRLEIKHFICSYKSKRENEKVAYFIQISGKERLEKWMENIGFNNPSKRTKYDIFKRYGFVPANTKINERYDMLNGDLSPWSFYQNGPVAQLG